MSTPKDILTAGAEILGHELMPHAFVFAYGGDGQSSGGPFAWGEFVRGDRRLELHYRFSLGLVAYHIGKDQAPHEVYMRELGVLGRNRYPGSSAEPLESFRDLAADLGFASDFISGDATVLRAAARHYAESMQEESSDLMSGYVGDTSRLERMRELFRQRRYAEVLLLFGELRFPDRLTEIQKQFVKVARERTSR